MIKYELRPCKQLKPLEDEKTYITENLISSFHIVLPSTFGDYPIKELELELRCYLPTVNDGVTEYSEYMGYQIDVTQKVAEIPITNDITGAVQIVKVMIIATKDGNVIGKTNFVDKQIYDAPLKGDPLTPREQFDTVIREQRETIEGQGQTITEQQSTITEQGEQITELNSEVTELTTENTNLSNQNETYRQTIQTFIDNPAPQLDTPDPVTPSTIQQTIRPESPAVGLTAVVVNGIDPIQLGFDPQYYEVGHSFLGIAGTNNTDLQVFLSRDDTVEPFDIECSASKIGGYLFWEQTRMRNCVLTGNPTEISYDAFYSCIMLEKMTIPSSVKSVGYEAFRGCANILTLELQQGLELIDYRAFDGLAIVDLIIPNTVTYLGAFCFRDCFPLTNVFIPASIITIAQNNTFMGCSKLKNVTIENGFNCNNLNLAPSTLYSHDTILSWFNALADRTGQTAYTLTIGATNIAKMTAEEIAIATNKNWNIA